MNSSRIELNPRVCGGKPVIKGTRIPVSVVVAHVASGESWVSIVQGFPELTEADIRAALEFASAAVENTEFVFPVAA